MGNQLEGRVALVTGASRGIGAGVAHRLAAEGARVAVVARTLQEGSSHLEGSLEHTVELIQSKGGEAVPIVADLSSPDTDRGAIVTEAVAAFGAPVDVLVNNAAAAFYHPFPEVSERRLRVAMEVNIWTPWALMQHVLPGMLETGRGWIVNISSATAKPPSGPPFRATGIGGACVYGGTKAMLDRFTIGAAIDLAGSGIAINGVRPTAAVLTEGAAVLANLDGALVEPMDTMCEAVLALCVCDPEVISGRVFDTLGLLCELDRPVYDLDGTSLTPHWQPADIPAQMAPFVTR